MARLLRALGFLAASLALLGPPAAGVAVPTANVTGPGSQNVGYTMPAAVYVQGGSLTFANVDIFLHDFVATEDHGPGTRPWCVDFAPGNCPLFWTPLLATGETALVQGLELTEAGRIYKFHCTIHPPMEGKLVVLGA